MEADLSIIKDEIAAIENKYPQYFKDKNLKLEDCITLETFSVPPIEKRLPDSTYHNFRLTEKIKLPDEVMNAFMIEVGKKLKS